MVVPREAETNGSYILKTCVLPLRETQIRTAEMMLHRLILQSLTGQAVKKEAPFITGKTEGKAF